MIQKNKFQTHLKWLKYTMCLILLLCNYTLAKAGNTAFVQQQDTTSADSLVLDGMSKKNTIQQRHINTWNKTIPKLLNVEGSSTIYAEDINSTPVSSITNVIAGRVPGLYTVQSSGRTGPLFDLATLNLRGRTPIFVIDGVIRSFISFNVNDIKSITVMKDALSTNMYGLRSGNGVVYITTKDRSDDKQFELNFSAQYGVLSQLKRPNFLNGANYASLYNEAQQNTFPGAAPAFSAATISAYRNGTNDPYLQPNNDWYNTIYKNNTTQKRYSIDASGNGKNYRYYTAIEHFSQDGNFISDPVNSYQTSNYYKRYNLRTNAQIDFSPNIQLSLNLFGSIENNNEPGAVGLSNGFLNAGGNAIMDRVYSTSPLAYPARNADGTYGADLLNTATIGGVNYSTNILGSTLSSGYVTYNERSLSADVALKFKLDDLLKGLWLKGSASVNNYYMQGVNRVKNFAAYYPTTTPDGTTYNIIGSDGTIQAGKGVPFIIQQNKQTFFNGLMGYDRNFGKNSLSILGSYNLDNIINSYTLLNQIYQTTGVRASYDYDKTYLAELSLSYSGFNRFEPGHRWGFLPSIGLGWVLSNEEWFKNEVVSFMKIKTSFGKTAWANPNVYYTYMQNYNGSDGYNFGSSPTAVSGMAESALANPGITWEKAWKFDATVEAAFFKNKLNAELSYYNNKYFDLLQIPGNGNASGLIGQSYPLVNLGKNGYNGFEASIGFNDKADAVNYFIKGNFSIARNKILDANEGNYPYPWLYKAGQPAATFGYEAIGFYQQGEDVSKIPGIPGYSPQPGDIKYKDLNGDGVINFLDQKAISGTKPLVFFGLNLGFNYKNFDFSALFEGRLNRDLLYSPSALTAFNNGYGNVLDYTTENRWTVQNTHNATLPRLTLGSNTNNQQVSTFWIRKADYLRLKNAEIGYTLPEKWLKNASIRRLRIFVNAYNLLTFTKLDYFDPETGLSAFPNNRIINGGVSLKL